MDWLNVFGLIMIIVIMIPNIIFAIRCKEGFENKWSNRIVEVAEQIGSFMKEYNDADISFSPMSDETMSWLDELLMTCKRFGVDYYNASEKDRTFVEAVARKNYGIKPAHSVGKPISTVEPFFGIHRAV